MNRRSFVAGSAAAVVARAIPAAASQPDFDVLIVGAGAAGIAAARRIAGAGRSYVVLEASERWGGRCHTDAKTFRVPYERGARWLYTPELNPLAKLASRCGLEIESTAPGERLRIGRRNARDGELEDFLASLIRCKRAISDVGRGSVDLSCADALPKDLGDWRATMEFMLGDFGSGKPLASLSAMDFAKSAERDSTAFCRQGLGTLISKLAVGLAIQFYSPVTQIQWSGRLVEAQSRGTTITARAAIVTVSTGVLGSGKLKFLPNLPPRHTEAIGKLGLGHHEHVAIQFTGNALGLQNDEAVFEKTTDKRTAALFANVSGSGLSIVELGGKLAGELAEEGESAMTGFAIDWLAALFGSQIKAAVERAHATSWTKDPWVLGAFSAASPGGQWARRALAEPVGERVWFAGEAVHETLWGTVDGAWEAGENAADAALKQLGKNESAPRARHA